MTPICKNNLSMSADLIRLAKLAQTYLGVLLTRHCQGFCLMRPVCSEGFCSKHLSQIDVTIHKSTCVAGIFDFTRHHPMILCNLESFQRHRPRVSVRDPRVEEGRGNETSPLSDRCSDTIHQRSAGMLHFLPQGFTQDALPPPEVSTAPFEGFC